MTKTPSNLGPHTMQNHSDSCGNITFFSSHQKRFFFAKLTSLWDLRRPLEISVGL